MGECAFQVLQEVQNVIADELAVNAVKTINKKTNLADNVIVVKELHLTGLDFLGENHVGSDVKGSKADVIRVDLVEGPGRFDGVFLTPSFSPKTGHDIFTERNPRSNDLFACLHMLLGCYTFSNIGEKGVVARFHTHVDS